MTLDDYLIRNVSHEEFKTLKDEEPDIIGDLIDGFNDVWRQKVKDVRAIFMYNPKRNMIGMYLLNNRKEKLVVERGKLSEAEETVIRGLYGALLQRLDRLRLSTEQ